MSDNLAAILLRHAAIQPDALAARADGQSLTYGELAFASSRLAALLHARGVERLAILGSRSLGAFVGVLGAFWAQVTYVPLSLKAPPERLADMLRQAGCDAILIDQHGAGLLDDILMQAAPALVIAADAPASAALARRDCAFHALLTMTAEPIAPVQAYPARPAYIIFTSGTTGSPKGVVVSAGAAIGLIEALRERCGIRPDDKVAETADLSFDLSVGNMVMAWDAGASLHAVKPMEMLAPARFIRANAITVWCSVPSVISRMQRAGALHAGIFPLLRYCVFVGEPLPVSAAEAWQLAAPNSIIDNLYGPTEGCVYYLGHRYTGDPQVTPETGTVCIGLPFPGLDATIVDDACRMLPPNARGELALSGRQLADGYLDRPELTTERFRLIDGRRWYLTGDAAYRDDESRFHHLGRVDNQIKVLGYRVELEEVESHLRDLCAGAAVAVVGWPRLGGAIEGLVGFAVAGPAIIAAAGASLSARLPAYMVPSVIHAIADMPLNGNGKLDRAALVRLLDSGWPAQA
jgi:amino acid adenylation domain-containing protein